MPRAGSISTIDVNCPANACCCHVAGEFRVFDRHAAQQVINSTAEAAFVVGKFAISDSQSTPAFSGNRAATAFGIIPREPSLPLNKLLITVVVLRKPV
jgi:exopolysaccharide biosynthesis protein